MSGRIANRPKFREMLDAAKGPTPPFQEILVWKLSRFTRKREDAVIFKAMLRRRGIKVTSITEPADDSPMGKMIDGVETYPFKVETGVRTPLGAPTFTRVFGHPCSFR